MAYRLKMMFRYTIEDDWPMVDREFLDVEMAGPHYVLLEVPVFARNVNRLDLVSGDRESGRLVFSDVVEHRGRSTVRLILLEEDDPIRVLNEFSDLGCDAGETQFRSLLTLDIPEDVPYPPIRRALEEGRALDRWDFEEASVPYDGAHDPACSVCGSPEPADGFAEGSLEHAETERLRQFYLERVGEQSKGNLEYPKHWAHLQEKLLAYGGVLAVPPQLPEPCINDLLASGFLWTYEVTSSPGAPNNCHRNVANEWQKGNLDSIGTGYRLDKDGLWRQHSWGSRSSDGSTLLVETTSQGVCYFGRRLQGAAADRFAEAQLQPSRGA